MAWHPLGWRPAWFSEIDKAASAVLAHRFPHIQNLGDMSCLPDMVRCGLIEAPDILVGGPPCQAFSIAGRREGLSDARGQLTLSYVELADAIDDARAAAGEEPCIIVYENVPGILSDKTGAFGCFLAGLAGESEPLVPPGPRPAVGKSDKLWQWNRERGEHVPKWTHAGYVLGPKRAVAWRVQDAQYHGLAQRRARVLVVASALEGFDPAEVLLEFDGLRRDSPPSREAREDIAGTLDARTDGGGFPGSDGACANHVVPACRVSGQDGDGGGEAGGLRGGPDGRVRGAAGIAFGGNRQSGPLDVATACNARGGPHGRLDFESETFVVEAFDVKRGLAPHGSAQTSDIAFPFTATDHKDPQIICFSSKDYGADATDDLSPTLRAGGHDGSHANAGVPPAVAYSVALRGRDGGGTAELGDDLSGCLRASGGGGDKPHVLAPVCVTGEITHTLKAEGFDASEDGMGRGQPIVAFDTTQITSPDNYSNPKPGDPCHPLAAGAHPPAVITDMAVRRLMPIECEALQGFPSNWTRIPVRHYRTRKITDTRPEDMWEPDPNGGWWLMAADGPRYKQLGNSMAVDKIHWLGRRIIRHLEALPYLRIIG